LTEAFFLSSASKEFTTKNFNYTSRESKDKKFSEEQSDTSMESRERKNLYAVKPL